MVNNFEKIYSENYNKILVLVLSKTNNNRAVSEEITNDVFVKVYHSLNMFDDTRAKFNTWLYTIANNTIIDYYRKEKGKNVQHSIDMNDLYNDDNRTYHFDISSSECTPEEKMMNDELASKIRKAVSKLTKNSYKRIFILRYYNQKSYEEISELLGINIGTIKGTLHRIREQLTKELANEYNG
jgi:RNA polymerase sigma-70 factor (ECF subfamily)